MMLWNENLFLFSITMVNTKPIINRLNEYAYIAVALVAGLVMFAAGCQPVRKSDSGLSENMTSGEKLIESALPQKHLPIKRDKSLIRICPNTRVPKTLDPAPFVNKQISYLLFDSLVKWDNKGKIVNSIASQIKRLDPTTLEITLKENIHFHNGEPLKADSVKFSIERLLDKKNNSPLYSLLNSISRIELIDDYKLKIYTKKPDYALVQKLAYVHIIPADYFKQVGETNFGKHPVGSGLYKFYLWDKEGTLTLKRNNSYWQPARPVIETVMFQFITGKKEQLQALIDGKVDVLLELQGVYTLQVQKHPHTKVIKLLNPPLVYRMKLNPQKEPFSDLNLRKAVNLAVNRNLLIKLFEKGNGRKIATNSIDIDLGHNAALKPYPYDPSLAKKLVEESGKKDLQINIAATDYARPIAMAIKKDIEKIGIKAQCTIMSANEMTKEFMAHSKNKTVPWKYDMAIFASKNPLFHAGIIYEEGLCSSGAWSLTINKDVDALCDQLKASIEEEQQVVICNKLEELAYENYWYTPIFQIKSTYGAAKDLNIKIPNSTYIDIASAYYDSEN